MKPTFRTLLPLLFLAFFSFPVGAQPASEKKAVTTPKQFLGFAIGDDYCLANYKQYSEYLHKIQGETDRMVLKTIGTTEEGRPELMAIVSSPANLKKLDRYQEISKKLALAQGISPAEATKLSIEGKSVVWIDGGLHASESLCAQVLIEMIYQMVSANDPETLRILDDVIILFVHANPDGMDLVANWYMRAKEPEKRSLNNLPRLYQKYVGHDNNRDFYANTQSETKNMNRIMYREWFPQIVYNHHQTGPPGTVLFCPPFRDPFNYNVHPLAISGIDAVGAAMMQRFLAEDKPGATVRSGAPYSTWFNGGLRTTVGFHNMIGILTETIGSPTPSRIPYLPAKQLPKADYFEPIPPQAWHFRQSVDYSVTANKAVLDYASRYREELLHNIWFMGNAAIERGNRDSWTTTPKMVEAAKAARAATSGAGTVKEFDKYFRDPAKRDPRGYILSANQPDFLTAIKFANALFDAGVQILRAKADFEVAGKKYPVGSLVVKSAQPFRAHAIDMFEPQDHPNDIAYPGAVPTKPYDAAGYTLAFQMGVKFDRILEKIDGPFEEITAELTPPPAKVAAGEGTVGFFLNAHRNDSYRALNRLLKEGQAVQILHEPFTVSEATYPPGTFYIARKETTLPSLEKIAAELGTPFKGTTTAPGKEAMAIKPARIGLWDRYGGSMPSGWTRWLLERFEFPFQVVYAPELDKGDLKNKYDVLILVDGALTARERPAGKGANRPMGGGGGDQPEGENPSKDATIPPEFKNHIGTLTQATTVPQLKKFLEAGGTILTIGTSTILGKEIGLPISNYLVEKKDGEEKPLPAEKFYVPPSVLRMKVNKSSSLAWGMDDEVDVVFASSPTFKLGDDAAKANLHKVAWFEGKTPLLSGWAWGQEHLDGGTAIIDAKVGQGRLVMFGPQILYRAQPHGTFKFLFNGIVQAGIVEQKK